jgi:MFS family permease
VFTLSPTFFEKVHQIPVEDRLWMASIPMFVGWFGMVSGGFTTDFLAKKIGLRWGRALPMSLSRFSAMAAYIYCLTNPSPWAFVAAFSVVAFSTDLGTASSWAFKQDVGGKYVGSVLGWANMWGNLGAAFSVPLLIWIVNDKSAFLAQVSSWFGETGGKNWNLAFLVCAIAFLIAGIACLGVNATKPIAPKDEDDEDLSDA